MSRPCHQSQFAHALAECNISLIGSTRKSRRWTVLIREEIIKLGAPGKISPSEHYCKVHKTNKSPSSSLFAERDKKETRNVDRWRRFRALSSLQPFSSFFSPGPPPTSCGRMQEEMLGSRHPRQSEVTPPPAEHRQQTRNSKPVAPRQIWALSSPSLDLSAHEGSLCNNTPAEAAAASFIFEEN